MIPGCSRNDGRARIIAVIDGRISGCRCGFEYLNGIEWQEGLGLKFKTVPAVHGNHITVSRVYFSSGGILSYPKTDGHLCRIQGLCVRNFNISTLIKMISHTRTAEAVSSQ